MTEDSIRKNGGKAVGPKQGKKVDKEDQPAMEPTALQAAAAAARPPLIDITRHRSGGSILWSTRGPGLGAKYLAMARDSWKPGSARLALQSLSARLGQDLHATTKLGVLLELPHRIRVRRFELLCSLICRVKASSGKYKRLLLDWFLF
ncbi:hypothetical protein VOLCADRAFT_107010 [Volvox carteri f. nagariensis]|uniref:Uncharacterized protein n=1 Tax=Volvox carteri f. nagariensis TaxID=3068 RepID=D8UBA4_VOLCA|nr:uncharacterized protein VOLCADRAFT_107010 [Volvox carteri f. nagariensis]EFJ42914.1 hypothetical protein VOLCADRAFT_107010 [Volvox carteri f. nagariensis]|eukprot:XP_002955954.1 hypothetical protein VOLCADRAFT_107010 [Volvox carteri f. nagariensis]